jgi:hypothetical protein
MNAGEILPQGQLSASDMGQMRFYGHLADQARGCGRNAHDCGTTLYRPLDERQNRFLYHGLSLKWIFIHYPSG